MNEEREDTQTDRDTTSPPDPIHEATTPPGQGDRDEEAIKEAEDKFGQAGGGH